MSTWNSSPKMWYYHGPEILVKTGSSASLPGERKATDKLNLEMEGIAVRREVASLFST